MKFIAIILALFVAFPNMGYALVNDCCSHQQAIQENCEDIIDIDLNHNDEDTTKGDHEPCPSQCDCSCCMHSFLIKDTIDYNDKAIIAIKNGSPISSGSSFSLGFYNTIWQPPQAS